MNKNNVSSRSFFLLVIISTLIFFTSCDKLKNTFHDTGKDTNTTVSVDSYPLFPQCKDVKNKILQKKCFQDAIYTYYKTHLEGLNFSSGTPIDETIKIKLEVSSDGTAKIIHIDAPDVINQAFPDLIANLHSFTSDIRFTTPAMKDGKPVTTRYTLPVRFKSAPAE